MANSSEELSIIETVLAYCESGSTHMQPDVMLNPVSHYTDAARLKQETNILFRKFPIIVGHVERLAEPGQFFVHDDTGIPILVTRNRTGELRALVNVCRHRGARVVNEPCGRANTFSCPYHSWTYDLDGGLRGMRHPFGFNELDKDANGLVQLPAFERFGLLWVRPQPSDKEVDIDAWLEPMQEQLSSLNLESYSIFREWSIPQNMNWRLALEGFQESYHFCSAHRTTACSSYLDNQSVFVDHYPHFRHAVPLSKIAELKGTQPDAWDYRSYFMTQNYLFPCNFVQVMTDHAYVHTIIPTGPGTCVFKCMMLIPEVAKSEKAERYWEKNYEVVRAVFNEDFAIGEGIQKGFEANANENFVFGRYEAGLHLGQKAIEDALAGRLAA